MIMVYTLTNNIKGISLLRTVLGDSAQTLQIQEKYPFGYMFQIIVTLKWQSPTNANVYQGQAKKRNNI